MAAVSVEAIRARWERECKVDLLQRLKAGEDPDKAAEYVHRRWHRVVGLDQLKTGARWMLDFMGREPVRGYCPPGRGQ